jgi:hypothetical protein
MSCKWDSGRSWHWCIMFSLRVKYHYFLYHCSDKIVPYRLAFIVYTRRQYFIYIYIYIYIYPLEVTQILEYIQNVFCTRSIQNKYLDVVLCGILYFLRVANLLRPYFSGNIWDTYTCVLVSCTKCLHDLYLVP